MTDPLAPSTVGLGLRDVTRVYDGACEVRALDGVTTTIPAGQVVAVVGPSGSGKSTLLAIAGLLEQPTEGDVCVGGVTTTGLRERDLVAVRRRHLGYVFQDHQVLGHLTAAENLDIAARYRGIPRRQRREATGDALDALGLAPRIDALGRQLSGGERQRVAIARALLGRPTLLLCDEPTGNLDSRTSERVLDALVGPATEGVTVVLVTHDGDVAARADRRISLRDGRILTDTLATDTREMGDA